jgi:hypothetical protein
MLFVMKKNETLDPVDIGLLGTQGIIFAPDTLPYLVKKAWFAGFVDKCLANRYILAATAWHVSRKYG